MKKQFTTQRFALTVITRPDAFRIKLEKPPRKKITDYEDFWLIATPVLFILPFVGLFALMITSK